MKLSESEIKDVMEIQKRLLAKVETYQKEIRMLEQNYKILGNVLAESSFTSAADLLLQEQSPAGASSSYDDDDAQSADTAVAATAPPKDLIAETAAHDNAERHGGGGGGGGADEPIAVPIRDGNTNEVIATAYRTSDYISIMMSDKSPQSMTINVEPFNSFFLNRILYEMKKADLEKVQNGSITSQAAINYNVETDPDTDRIINIVIRNYRDERRASELISTAAWSFTKMLERIRQQQQQ